MKNLTLSLFGAILLSSSIQGAPTKPNIVLILADDLGWKDVGYNGSDYYETPNIDRLAKEGMTFVSAYAGGANCQPSRACLMSGQYTPRHGVYAVDSTSRGPENLMRMVPVPNTPYLASDNVTVAEALKAAGYATGHFGKWHLGGPKWKGTSPREQGFDFSMDVVQTGSGVRDDPKGMFEITRSACNFVDTNKDRPFFAYVAHHAIHTGHQARQATLDKFKAKAPGQQHQNALYAACTYDFDEALGLLVKQITALGLDKRTLLIFTSDNGGIQQSSQEPLRGNKGCYYEGGVREPFIAVWPGVIKPGSRCAVPIINQDLYPTFLEVAHAPVPSGKVLDGESLFALLKGGAALERQSIFWHFPGYLNTAVIRGRDPLFRTRPTSVIRKGDWKLHLLHEEWQLDGGRAGMATNRSVELYNLKDDIGERVDLASSNTDKRDELLGDLLSWFKKVDARLPTECNPGYKPGAQVTEEKQGKGRRKRNRQAATAE